jgi:hypothetical protein
VSSARGGAAAVAAFAVLLLATAAPAAAARNLNGVPANLTERVTTPNFVVHFTMQDDDPNAISLAAAQQLANNAERAVGDEESRLQFPSPVTDGDGHADLYVFATSKGLEPGLVRADSRGDQVSGFIAVPPTATGDIGTIAHEVFHLLQLAVYRPAGSVLAEGGATWAAMSLYSGEMRRLPDIAQPFPQDPLDCTDTAKCAQPGYSAWPFFEYLAEHYGPDVVRRLYDGSRKLGADDHGSHFRAALDNLLTAQGTDLTSTFAAFVTANLVGDYALAGLRKKRYAATEPFFDLATGPRKRNFRPRVVKLDHLTSAYFRLRSGTDTTSSASKSCRRVELVLTVTGPADLEAPLQYALFRPHQSGAKPLQLVAGRVRQVVPWSTCRGRELGLSLLNPSGSIDHRRFSLRVELRD